MIDFSKLSSSEAETSSVNPIEIYNNLDRSADTSELRSAQEHILSEWFSNHYDEKDVVVKMHTGDGKTLVGLLMLYSKMNNNQGPSLYVCPNRQLVSQVQKEAERFGIPFMNIEECDGNIPNEFTESKSILGVTVQKLFNGRSKFGLDKDSVPVGCIVLDDAHACIDSIRKAFTICIPREDGLYEKLLQLFWDDLANQGEGSLREVSENNFSSTVVAVPYWCWIDKSSEVTRLLSTLANDDSESRNNAFFTWPLLKDSLVDCQMLVSARWIEINPYFPRVSRFSSFACASQRIIMSATTQDDSFFIKGLDFTEQSIKTPLQLSSLKWSGEKMIIIPSQIDQSMTRETIIDAFFDSTKKTYGTVSLVPSLLCASEYPTEGVCVSNSNNISTIIESLKNKDFSNKIVLVNRYDGIDLPDSACRLLIIDSMPKGSMLVDRYEDMCRHESDIVRARTAQKIEQGLGRGVRGEKDYCAILVIGAELVRFIKSSQTNKYFSPQTRKQVLIGIHLSELQRKQKGKDPLSDLNSLLDQLLYRDPGWKKYYNDQLSNNEHQPFTHDFYYIFAQEKRAEEMHWKGEDIQAAECIQSLIDQCRFVGNERGWYLQLMARYYYYADKVRSESLQKNAFALNYSLFKPNSGVKYSKLQPLDEDQVSSLGKRIRSYVDYNELHMEIEEFLSKLSFGVSSNDFENALYKIGQFLGWSSSRPDKEYRVGPDVLFCSAGQNYVAFECKNEVLEDRETISKREAGQMNNHFGWFERNYGEHVPVEFYWIIPVNRLAEDADLTQKARIIQQEGLSKFKNNVSLFVNACQQYELRAITDLTIAKLINNYKLTIDCFRSEYSIEVGR